MAGSGDPWSYFKPSSKLTLRALHDGYSLVDIQRMFQTSEDDLLEKIGLLVDAGLVKKERGRYCPAFLIVDAEETTKTFYHAKRFGRIIADELTNNLEAITRGFSYLEISERHTLDELSLVLIGSKILDIALLEVLAKDRTLLRPPPKRPSPNRPDARYYFFMIDGPPDYLGKYGENSENLPWTNWTFITFGQNTIQGQKNIPRENLEARCNEMLEKHKPKTLETLAEGLHVPVLSCKDSLAWRETARNAAQQILLKIKENEDILLRFYNSLKASKYPNSNIGEFMCWYIHVAYAWAIDFLVEEKIIYMPDDKFGSLIMYSEAPEGLLAS